MLVHVCFFLNFPQLWLQKTTQCKGYFLCCCAVISLPIFLSEWKLDPKTALHPITPPRCELLRFLWPYWTYAKSFQTACLGIQEDHVLVLSVQLFPVLMSSKNQREETSFQAFACHFLISEDCQCLQSSWLIFQFSCVIILFNKMCKSQEICEYLEKKLDNLN